MSPCIILKGQWLRFHCVSVLRYHVSYWRDSGYVSILFLFHNVIICTTLLSHHVSYWRDSGYVSTLFLFHDVIICFFLLLLCKTLIKT